MENLNVHRRRESIFFFFTLMATQRREAQSPCLSKRVPRGPPSPSSDGRAGASWVCRARMVKL